ncbi:MAG: DUF362 domain-containing protein [Deltaproteobacteria bacterium]|nr:DUF362 domain-containing protein [Deltaproteobacteria bacterium]
MDPNAAKPKVILRHCDGYDPQAIRKIIREGLEELGLRPFGRTLLKPNVVASGELFEHAHTRAEFVEGVILALKDREGGDKPVHEIAVGERCGITVPTRFSFEGAGYYPMFERTGVKHYCFEEVPQVEIRYTHPERLRDYVFTPEPVAHADFFVNLPKFKSHPWTTVTFAMKNYIGIQDDRHRLIDHDHRLDDKVADLQHIVQPQFVAIDCIIAGEGRMLTPIPREMNLIIMGNNQCAIDAVSCMIIGVDPRSVDHIRMASERGFGPIDLEHIELSGDVTLAEAKRRAQGFKVGLIRVEKYFEGTSITAYAGPPPEPERTDYCWGGCPGAIEEAIEILRLFDEQTDAKMPRLHVVFGKYDGPIDAKPGEKVIFIGDCAEWKGQIGEKLVQISSKYKGREEKDQYTAKHDDIYAKMVTVSAKLLKGRGEQVLRLEGCPVSVAEQVLALVSVGNLKNPYFDANNIVGFNKAYIQWRAVAAAKRIRGIPYQKHGPSHRGEGAPSIDPKTASYLAMAAATNPDAED